MPPVLILLIGIGLFILWFLLSFLYKPLGDLIRRIFNDSMEAMGVGELENEEEDKNE